MLFPSSSFCLDLGGPLSVPGLTGRRILVGLHVPCHGVADGSQPDELWCVR